MMQMPLEQHKTCPQCGFTKAILIMDFYGTLPQLDILGYPQYHCPQCANTFTALDEPTTPTATTDEHPATSEKEGDEHGHN